MAKFVFDDSRSVARLKICVLVGMCTVEDSGEVIAEFTAMNDRILAIAAAGGEMYSTADFAAETMEECIQTLEFILNKPEAPSRLVWINGSHCAEVEWDNLSLVGFPHSYKLKCAESHLADFDEQGHSHSTALYHLVMRCFRMIKSLETSGHV